MSLVTIGKSLAAIVVVTGGGWAAGRLSTEEIQKLRTPAQAAAETPTPKSRLVKARLTSEASRLVVPGPGGGSSTYAVLIRAKDCLTCEDIGHQLRELAESVPAGSTIRVLSDSAGVATTSEFLRRERVVVASIDTIDLASVIAGRPGVLSPSLVVRPTNADSVVLIEHMRFRNVRPKSFAAELREIAAKDTGAATPH
jgi:hypothetical protein